jgi:hypothetical protein
MSVEQMYHELTADEKKVFDDRMEAHASLVMGSIKPIKTEEGNAHWHKVPPSDLSRPPVAVMEEGAPSQFLTPPPSPSTENPEVMSAMDRLAKVLGLK